MALKEVIQFLVDLGLIDVVLPFILVFVIVFGMLQSTKVLGEEKGKPKRKQNLMIAFVFGFLAVLATSQLKVVNILLSYIVLLLIIGLLMAMIFGLVGAKMGSTNKFAIGIIGILFVIGVLYAFAQAGIIDQQRVNQLFWPIILIGAIIAVVFFMLRKEETGRRPPQQQQRARPAAEIGPEQLEREGVIWRG
ncbi:MAG TPA: hypothetical protein VI612_00960 [Candidatus Nanoarchaeia archaeon]|nr:hypothetical protein [Candidatus Nanoarchaeia archaeon]